MSKQINEFYENAISLVDFLERYCGINNINNKRITHQNVKSLFPQIKRSSFEEVIKNPELVYTGKVVFVKDFNNECIPYLTGYDLEIENFGLDRRELLICELVSAIGKIVNHLNKSLIILENHDSISDHLLDSSKKEIDIASDEIIKINNNGGILIKNTESIFTFQYLVYKLLNSQEMCYSKNSDNASELSKEHDIISINITNQGRIYIAYNGETSEKMNLLDLRNFLLKSYYPRKIEEDECEEDLDLYYLEDYELEKLVRRFYKEKNEEMYEKCRRELGRRRKIHKKENEGRNKLRRKDEKIRIKTYEEEYK